MSIDTFYGNSSASAATTAASSDRMNELTMSDFINMMTAELTNQDPTNPMSNTEMLSQISQIRSITSNDRLTSGIEALTLGQSLSTASSLIGKTITGVNSISETITGKVDKVTIEDGKAKLFVGSSIVNVENVTAISAD
ncbi:MAG: flagellar hook capping protein [Planctomycetaceae bacterium]|jgi:flagellar basal-body rod modification protein FlgD|nr:flagellar hook capping protein [Planctomycetaceae bacterium]